MVDTSTSVSQSWRPPGVSLIREPYPSVGKRLTCKHQPLIGSGKEQLRWEKTLLRLMKRILRETYDRCPQEVLDALPSATLDWAHGSLQIDAAIIVIEHH